MTFDPDKHHRRSIRLRGYNYALPGAYFITICAHDRTCLFGQITDGNMRSNQTGEMVEKWWLKIPSRFPSAELDEHVVMPNHFHAILVTMDADPRVDADPGPPVGADPRVMGINLRD